MTTTTKKKRVLLDPVLTAGLKKTGIARPRPDGGVKKRVLLDPVLMAG